MENLTKDEILLLEKIKLNDYSATKVLLDNNTNPFIGYWENRDEPNEKYVSTLGLAIELDNFDILNLLVPLIYGTGHLTDLEYFDATGATEDCLKYCIEINSKEKIDTLLFYIKKYQLYSQMDMRIFLGIDDELYKKLYTLDYYC